MLCQGLSTNGIGKASNGKRNTPYRIDSIRSSIGMNANATELSATP